MAPLNEHPNLGNRRIALVLQGGGAVGAYQVGVYEALDIAGYRPDWFVGTSIGGINAAIMAGNAPERRAEQLVRFWGRIGRPTYFAAPMVVLPRQFFNRMSAVQTMFFGQSGFFRPHGVHPTLAPEGHPASTSYYDASQLRQTLEEFVDFERINAGGTRLSLGAVNVVSGRQVYFDSRSQPIGLQHVMASAALPPAFGPVEVDGTWYWDGGIVSNTPLDAVIDDNPRENTLCFMIDLFDARGDLPKSIDAVETRRKDIIYASRSGRSIEQHRSLHNLRRAINALWTRLPEDAKEEAHLRELAEYGCTTTMQVVHILRRAHGEDASWKDYEFSEASIAERRTAGFRDTQKILEAPAWNDAVPQDVGVIVYGDSNIAVDQGPAEEIAASDRTQIDGRGLQCSHIEK